VVIRELKSSQRVEGRWLAFLEDGTILRLGENEVIDFALYAGKELSDEDSAALQDSARRSALKGKTIELLSRKPQSRKRWSASWRSGKQAKRSLPPSVTGWRSWVT